jgi:hypothetical protein
MEKITGDVLRRRVMGGKEGQIIQVAVVEFGQDISGGSLDFSKVQDHSALVQVSPRDHRLHLPVVPMEGLALAAKIAEVMGGGELADDLELIHLRLSRIGLATLLAAAVGSDDADARAVTAKKPLGEIHGILITAGGNATLDRVGRSLAGKSLTAPATILAPGGQLTLADGTDLPRNVFSTMWASHGSLASSSS